MQLGLYSCRSRDQRSDTLWIWKYATPPSGDCDAFTHLAAAAGTLDADGQIAARYEATFEGALVSLAGCRHFSGTLDRTSPDQFGNIYSTGLVSENELVEHGALFDVARAARLLCEEMLDSNSVAIARDIARSILVFGYQISRNGEDYLLAPTRLAVWQIGVDALISIAIHEGNSDIRQELEAKQVELREELEKVRQRDSNKVYFPFE
ncbi:MAG: hypothetical protein IH983_09935 [Planctomycetes bacterium]|nr:hypothetical protein [Planctomycetota bacterium]